MTTPKVLDVVTEVDKSLTNATTAKAITQELLLVSSPLTQCQDLLIPAPLAITLAARLILISNNNDFSLTKKEGGYKFLQWPSFRASFAQVAHQLQTAFRCADKNTLEIAIKASDIPNEFNRAVVIIKKTPSDEVSNLLKIPLEQIQSANDACLKLAKEVEDNFILVTHMTEELLEATLDKEKETQTSLKEIEKRRQGMLEAEKLAKTRKEENETRLKELEKKVDEADTLFKGTLDESDKFIMKAMLIENFTQITKTGISVIAPLFATNAMAAAASATAAAASTAPSVCEAFSKLRDTPDQVQNSHFEVTTVEGEKDNVRKNSKICAYSKAEPMLELAQKLMQFIGDGDKIGDDVLHAQDDQTYIYEYEEMKRSLSESSNYSKNARHALDLCARGWEICRNINMIRQGNFKEVMEVVEDIKKLHKDCKAFANKALHALGGNSGLGEFATKRSRSKTHGNELMFINHTHFKLERSLEYLKCKQEQFDKAQEERKQLLDEMAERVEQIQNLSIDEIDYKNVRECLLEGLRVLGNLRTQWENLVQYFQNMSTLIGMTLNTSKKFHLYAESVQKSQFLREFVYEEALKAVQLAVIVQQLSTTYNEISQIFLMPQVGAIDQFFNARNKDDQRIADEGLREYQLKAETGIRQIIAKNRAELSNATNARRMQLQAIKESLEVHMSEKDLLENKECVVSITYEDEDEEDVVNAQL